MQKRWNYVRFFVAAVLLSAAISKFVRMTEILAGDGLLGNRYMLLAVIGIETTLATFLLMGDLFHSWLAVFGTFGVFSVFSGYALATGKDCNCFANSIGPKVMLLFDLTVLVVAWLSKPLANQFSRRGPTIPIAGSLATGFLFAVAGLFYEHSGSKDPLQFLLADTLIGKAWPLDSAIHPTLTALESEKWMILVVRRDCEHCRRLVESQFVDPLKHRPGERTAVIVADGTNWLFAFDRVSFEVLNMQSIVWDLEEPFVASPAVFLVDAGIVVHARDGVDAGDFLEGLFGGNEPNKTLDPD